MLNYVPSETILAKYFDVLINLINIYVISNVKLDAS